MAERSVSRTLVIRGAALDAADLAGAEENFRAIEAQRDIDKEDDE